MAEDFLDGGVEAPGSDCTFCSGWAQNRAVSCLHPGALRTVMLWGSFQGAHLPGLPSHTTPVLGRCGLACAPLPLHPPGPRTQAVFMALADTFASHVVLSSS